MYEWQIRIYKFEIWQKIAYYSYNRIINSPAGRQVIHNHMLDLKNLQSALDELFTERGISKEKILETIELALAAAYKKEYGKRGQIIRAKFDPKTGKTNFSQIKIAVDESMLKSPEEEAEDDGTDYDREIEDETVKKVRFNPERHMMFDEAQKINPEAKPGDELVFPFESKEDYGRIAAQTAKQVIMQRLREAERESIFSEFAGKQGQSYQDLSSALKVKMFFLTLGAQQRSFPRKSRFGARDTESAKE